MTSILYIIPYFGKMPDLFPIWLHSCKNNPTVDWLIFTDDKTVYDYPKNVKVVYTSFEKIKELFQNLFDFEICLNAPYKLCDYRPCYGVAFQKYIKDYDYWGFCDLDLIWGDIRSVLTEDVFAKYEKIGYQGHSTLFKNIPKMNMLYSMSIGDETVKEKLQSPINEFIDEDFINRLCDHLRIPYYQEKSFANLSSFVYNFRLNHLEAKDKKKNRHFIFKYENGKLLRLSVVGSNIHSDEFMYIHFLKRKMEIEIDGDTDTYLIVPNKLIPMQDVTVPFIRKANAPHMISFAIQHFKENAYKLNWHTFFPILMTKIKGYFKLYTKY